MRLTYYPYFRGRQYELLALRDMVEKGLLSADVVPIVEPIKCIPQLASTFAAFEKHKHYIGVVRNPEHGDFIASLGKLQQEKRDELLSNLTGEHVKQVIIQNDKLVESIEKHKEDIIENPNRWVAIYTKEDYLDASLKLCKGDVVFGVNLIPDATPFRDGVVGPKVLFRDCFEKKRTNAEYGGRSDSLFTRDHTFALGSKYVGTADFSIIGSEYSESGFAPYAVAIHIVYEDPEHPSVIRIKHFVSDSNDGIDDTAGKFHEAAKKMASWVRTSGVYVSSGLRLLLDAYKEDKFPGLGSVKKYTIMHHLELMGKILATINAAQ